MTARAKLTLAGITAAGVAGLWLGYTRAAFFLPGWTVQRINALKPSADSPARLCIDFPTETT